MQGKRMKQYILGIVSLILAGVCFGVLFWCISVKNFVGAASCIIFGVVMVIMGCGNIVEYAGDET